MKTCSVLIVEDEKVVAKMVGETLERLGYRWAGHASSGEEAVKKVGESKPDLVLMDIVLAGEWDGIQAASEIASQYDVPVVYMTAHADERTLMRAREASPYGFVYKPVRDRELRAAIEVALDRHDLDTRLQESQQWLAATLRCISEAVVATDREGRIKFMSVIAEALAGVKQEQALGRDLLQVMPFQDPATGSSSERFWDRYLKEDELGAGYLRLDLPREGRTITVGCSLSAIRHGRQQPVGLVMVLRELDQRIKGGEAP
jgi:PAS domain S-box-containing protein